MKSLSKFIIETQSGGTKSGSGTEDPWFPNKNGKKNRKSNNRKSKGGINKIGSGVEDSGDKQVRSAASDPKSSEIKREIEGQTKRKTREFTQKDGVTKGNDPASMNRRLSAGTTKGDQLTKAYGTAGTSGDSNSGAGAGGASGNTKPSPTKPVSSAEKQMLKKTSRQTGGKVSVSYAEPVRKSGQDKLLDKIFSPKAKTGEKELTKAVVNRSSNKGPVNPRTGSRIPDARKGELGKLYQTSTKSDPKRGGSVRTTDKINQELTAKRAARINPNTGKATQKGVENFAINQQTRGLSNKGDAGKKALTNAKKIASDSSSKAYKDIETKINTSDYAGKRAQLASTKELKQIKSDIATSKTINQKGGKLNIPSTKSKLKGSGITYKKSDTEILPKTKEGTLKGFKTKRGGQVTVNTRPLKSLNPDQVAKMYQPDGGYGDSNTGYQGSGSTSKKSTFKNFTDKVDDASKRTKTNLFGKIKKAKFYPYAKGASRVGMRGLGLVGAGLQYKSNYDAAKGSKFRKTAKAITQTASSVAGFTGGAALGTGLGSVTGPGAFVTGTVSGLAASDLAHKASGKIFNKIWKPPTAKKKTEKKIITPPAVGSNNRNRGSSSVHRGISI